MARCAWCRQPIPAGARKDAKTCSKRCRQAAHRFRVAPAAETPASDRLRLAYADPPYPGLARRYYNCEEVDHVELVAQLERDYPDGWALSTSAEAHDDVMGIVRSELGPARARKEVRVGIWVRGSRASKCYGPRNAWEPLIVCRGRRRLLDPDQPLDDVLVWGGRQHSHPDALVGMKPAAFCEWMFRMLGAEPGDALGDLFPGSGAIGRAWAAYSRLGEQLDLSRLPGADPSLEYSEDRLPSRLAEAQLAVAEGLADASLVDDERPIRAGRSRRPSSSGAR